MGCSLFGIVYYFAVMIRFLLLFWFVFSFRLVMQVNGVYKTQDDTNPHNDIQQCKNFPKGGLRGIITIPNGG